MAFTKKQLTFGFQLANGNFGGGGNQATLTGYRAHANIVELGGESSGTMEGAIFGLPLATMNQLTQLQGIPTQSGKNGIMVQAGDAESGMSLVFQGHIFNAWIDGDPPNLSFRINANADGFEWVKSAKPTSIKGQADVANMMQTLAGQMGYKFENNDVNVKVMNPYLHGSARMQANELAKMAGIEHIVSKGTLAIWPAGGKRKGSGPIMISQETGMIGLPKFFSAQISVKKLFDPALIYGGEMTVKSALVNAANGTWKITRVESDLETMTPHGHFFQTMTGVKATAGQTTGDE